MTASASGLQGPREAATCWTNVPLWARLRDGIAFSDIPVREGGQVPDFCIVGAAKCGTTAIDLYLSLHPDIFMAPQKEIHYFSTPVIRERGIDWYTGLYAEARPGQFCGEASTSYTRAPFTVDCAAHMAATNPAMKLVYIVREPVARLESECLQTMKFLKNVLGDDLTHMPLDHFMDMVEDPNHSYYQASKDACRYDLQIAALEAHFPTEQILILLYDDLRADETGTLRRILEFLELDPEIPLNEKLRTNVTADFHEGIARQASLTGVKRLPLYSVVKRILPDPLKERILQFLQRSRPARPMRFSDSCRARLATEFEPHVEALEKRLGRSLMAWKSSGG